MQQINLFQASLRTPRQWLSASQLTIAVSVLFGVLIAVSSVQWWWLNRSNSQLQAAKQSQLTLAQRVDQLSKQIALSSNDSDLKKSLSDKESELEDKQYVLQALTGKHFGNTSGFAEQFTGLARQHVNGVWLTGLYIHAGGEKLNLQGSAYEAELVPRLLQRLAQEPSFQGIEFKTMLMQRAEKSTQIDFDLRSTAKEPG
jgi:Tfp pilus assembly protein PilN